MLLLGGTGITFDENRATAFVREVASPEVGGLTDELILQVHVPVLIVVVEFEFFVLVHVINGHDSVVSVEGFLLDG